MGSTSPNSKLEVAATTTHTYPTPGQAYGTLNIKPLSSATADQSTAITFGATQNVGGAQAGIYVQSSGAYGTKMYFGTTDSYASGSKARMLVDYNGNVGIGNISPAHTLDVNGIVNATSGFRVNGAAPASNVYMKGDGTKFVAGTIQASDVPTLNQNTTGWATYLKSPYPYNINITDATTAATLSEPGSLTSVNMHASHGLFGSWATTLTMSGYERYGAYQISGNYNSATPELAIRNYVQSTSTWNSWVKLITTANIGSYGDNLGNHVATTNLNMSYRNIYNGADIVSDLNYGLGLVGVYSSVRYQNVFAMGGAYRLAANGTTPGNLYGIAWTHTNVGGESKSGLSHQALFMNNGITQTAIGTGIWTNGNLTFAASNPTISAPSYFVAPGGAYFNSGIVYTEAAIRARGGITNDNGSSFLNLLGGTGGFYGTKVSNGSFVVDYNQNTTTGPYVSSNAGALTITGNQTTGNGEVNFWNTGPAGSNRGFSFWYWNGSSHSQQTLFRVGNSNLTTNGWGNFSDVRFKKNIEPLTGALDKVQQISGYTYYAKVEDFKRYDFHTGKYVGFIAQELQKVLPEAVDSDDQGMLSVDYGKVTPLLVEAIKEQQTQIEAIKHKLNDFGSVAVTGNEQWVNFDPAFTDNIDAAKLPVVTITANLPNVSMYVAEKNSKGFKVVIQSGMQQGLTIDYTAMAYGKAAAPVAKTDWNEVSRTLPIPPNMGGIPAAVPDKAPTKEALEAERMRKYYSKENIEIREKENDKNAPDAVLIDRK